MTKRAGPQTQGRSGNICVAMNICVLQARKDHGRYPEVLFVVTGKGPQRASYEAQLRRLDLRRVIHAAVTHYVLC